MNDRFDCNKLEALRVCLNVFPNALFQLFVLFIVRIENFKAEKKNW